MSEEEALNAIFIEHEEYRQHRNQVKREYRERHADEKIAEVSEQEALESVLARQETARQNHNRQGKEYYKRHAGKEEFRKRRAIAEMKTYHKNPEPKRQRTREYYEKNRDVINEKRREKYFADPESTWHKKNKDAHNAKQRERYHLRKMDTREKRNAQERERYHLRKLKNKEGSSLYGVGKKKNV